MVQLCAFLVGLRSRAQGSDLNIVRVMRLDHLLLAMPVLLPQRHILDAVDFSNRVLVTVVTMRGVADSLLDESYLLRHACTMRAEIIGHFEPCMTDIYIHIDARMADYIR